MTLLTLKNIYYSVGEFPLLDHVTLDIAEGERIALIGRNGTGKSTLMDLLYQKRPLEAGEIITPRPLVVAKLDQTFPLEGQETVYEVVAKGLQTVSTLLLQYHHHAHHYEEGERWLKTLDKLQHELDANDGWLFQERIERIIQELSLPADKLWSDLSGGWRRRVLLAQALVQDPDLLLLDEPTNHLDLEAIEWLEKMLLSYTKTVLFVTHDRALLKKIATKIVELDRGQVTVYPPDYEQYLERKAQLLVEEERHNALFDKKLSAEEQWVRQGIKARRTRNEGRVRALKALREQRKQRREQQTGPTFVANVLKSPSGKTVVQAEGVTFGYDPSRPLIRDFSFTIQRGDKVAIIGGNGAGKTTLVKLLLGLLTPNEGSIKRSPAIQVAFFDQNRDQLDPTITVRNNVAQGDDFIEIGGKRKHVIGYLGEFLFSPDKCNTLAAVLSGGEQNRLLLAKLFSTPSNVLVLDEPTNDLDVESLEVLENLLLNYEGTVIFISHDREFIDNVATHSILLEENGRCNINVGGYSDIKKTPPPPSLKPPSGKPARAASQTKKSALSYQEQQELAKLPTQIEQLEAEIATLEQQLADPRFYQQPREQIEPINAQLKRQKEILKEAYQRWEVLDLKNR